MSFTQPKTHLVGGITWVEESDLRASAANWEATQSQQPDVRAWSPFDIHVMLHHFAAREPFHRRDTPAYKDSIERLTALGLLRYDLKFDMPIATGLGEMLVNMWCLTPVPVVRYIDPRTGAAVG